MSGAIDPALLARGAEHAVGTCLAVGREDRTVIVTDATTLAIGRALEVAAREVAARERSCRGSRRTGAERSAWG